MSDTFLRFVLGVATACAGVFLAGWLVRIINDIFFTTREEREADKNWKKVKRDLDERAKSRR